MQTWNPFDAARRSIKNAPWIVMAIAIHVIVIVGLSIWYVSKEKAKTVESAIVIAIAPPRDNAQPVEIPKEEPINRHLVPENQNADLVTPEEQYPQTTDVVPDDVTLVRGDPNSIADSIDSAPTGGSAIGVGQGGHHGNGPSTSFTIRNPGSGGGHVGQPNGPTTITEKAILEGMRWLIRHQNPDGSWSAATLKDRCTSTPPCFDVKEDPHALYDEGVTALALLCFLGAGYSHESQQTIVDPVGARRYRIGTVVKDGLQWLAKRQDPNDGHFTRDRAYMYNEALASMAMAEAYGLTRSRYWKEPAQKGIDFLQRAQRPNPSGRGLWGWRYQPRSEIEDGREGRTGAEPSKELFDADTSVTTWCVMALKSAQLSGLAVKQEALDGALEFIQFVSADNGQAGYLDRKSAGATVTGKNDQFKYHPTTMSALAMCSRIFITHDADDPFLEPAAKQIVQDLPTVSKDKLSIDYYYWYYASLALNQFDGPDSPRRSNKFWLPWNRAMVEAVISLQNVEPTSCHRGGWTTLDRWSYTGGPIYTTAMSVLTLEVYYRYDNALGGPQRAHVQPVRAPAAAPGEQPK